LGELTERAHLEDVGQMEDNIKSIFKKRDVYMDWFDLARNRDRWRAVVNAVKSIRIP
jgi:hypothetical protein